MHRFGKFTNEKNHPIVARFLYHNDLVNVKKNAYKLKGKPYGIHEQYPVEIEERRKKLYSVQKRLKESGRRTKLVRDKLYVDGKLYQATHDDALHQEPMDIPCNRSYSDVTRSAPVQPCPNTHTPELCNVQRTTSSAMPATVIRSDPRHEDTRSVQVNRTST